MKKEKKRKKKKETEGAENKMAEMYDWERCRDGKSVSVREQKNRNGMEMG